MEALTSELPRDAAAMGERLAQRGRASATKAGLEVELGLLDEAGNPVPYERVRDLLERIQADDPGFWRPVDESGNLIALFGPRGESVTLEPGGQVELSSAPGESVSAAAEETAAGLRKLAAAAAAVGCQLVGGGLLPAPLEAVHWMPKGRYKLMRAWFKSLGQAGHLGHTMMQRTLSLQVSLDYTDARDAAELLRLTFLAAAPATAIWAASPWHYGAGEGEFQSFRAEAWRFTDPSRQGLIEPLLSPLAPEAALEAYAAHVLRAPMMFRVRGKEHLDMEGAIFGEALARGTWSDGEPVSETDLWNHNGSVFTDARLKPGLIEIRSTDGALPRGDLPLALAEVPAFWVGLAYDAQARGEALERLGGLSPAEVVASHDAVPREGLSAPWGEEYVLDVARDLVDYAAGGIERLRAAGREGPLASEALSVVRARLEREMSPADELLEVEAAGGRAALIEALRIR